MHLVDVHHVDLGATASSGSGAQASEGSSADANNGAMETFAISNSVAAMALGVIGGAAALVF